MLMFGWRARLGLIMPWNNTVIEPELLQAIPEGITLHGHRVGSRPDDRKGDYMEALRTDARNNGYKLGPVDCVAYCCLTTSFYKGLGYDKELIQEMKSSIGKPVTTAATAMVRSLKVSKIKKVAIASPFRPDVNSKLREFLKGNGFEIAGFKALDPAPTPQEVVLLPTTVAYRLASRAVEPESDGIFICATDFPSMTVIDALENDLKKPVISTNQAILWDMLRTLNMKTVIRGYGSLLENQQRTHI
jgi:arylmalonate decarboxylase